MHNVLSATEKIVSFFGLCGKLENAYVHASQTWRKGRERSVMFCARCARMWFVVCGRQGVTIVTNSVEGDRVSFVQGAATRCSPIRFPDG